MERGPEKPSGARRHEARVGNGEASRLVAGVYLRHNGKLTGKVGWRLTLGKGWPPGWAF